MFHFCTDSPAGDVSLYARFGCLLAMSLCTPALAASEYGVIYDETDELGSATLTMQGEQTLPELSETLGIDLRVDVLTQISYDSIADAAAGIYARYGYGYGEEREGATRSGALYGSAGVERRGHHHERRGADPGGV